MKKIITPIIFLISLSIILFVVFSSASTITKDEALEIGIQKYLKFLWMVDGAFNNDRLDGEFTVNDISLKEEDKIFTCTYKDKKTKECIGNNFEKEFDKLFVKRIMYEDVYSDNIMYSWYKYENGKHIFNNLDSCNISRMGLNQTIRVTNINSKTLEYIVSYENIQNQKIKNYEFILEYEDGDWKVSSATYSDLCGMSYKIK